MLVKAMLIKEKFVEKLFGKDKGAKEILVEVGLIVVAVFLIVLFRKQINQIMSDVFTKASSEIKALFN